MLLDEQEAIPSDVLEEKTIRKKKLLSVVWVIVGALGFLLGLLVITMEILQPVGGFKERLFVFLTAGVLSFLFSMLAFFGFKARFSLNKQYDNQKISSIPKYESYFWIGIFIFLSFNIYWFWNELQL